MKRFIPLAGFFIPFLLFCTDTFGQAGLFPGIDKINGNVNATAIDTVNKILYVGGSFSNINSDGRIGAVIYGDGSIKPGMPTPNNQVNAAVSDGQGGWYLGGAFQFVDNYSRGGLVHIRSNGSVNTNLDMVNGTVKSLLLSGDTLYAGGDFSAAGSELRSASSIATDGNGNISFDFPMINDAETIQDIAADGYGGWFIGGSFTKIRSTPRNYLAQILPNGQVGTWNADINGIVNQVEVVQNYVMISGNFSQVNGQPRVRFAMLDKNNGNLMPLVADIDGSVDASSFIITGDTLIIAGNFSRINGQNRNGIAMLQISSGVLLPAIISPNTSSVTSMLLYNNKLYFSGFFSQVNGITRGGLAGFDLTTNSLLNFNPFTGFSSINSLLLDGNLMYTIGGFNNVGGIARNRVAAFDLSTETLTSFNPGIVNYNVTPTITTSPSKGFISGNSLYLTGTFMAVDEISRPGIAAVDKNNGSLLSYNPFTSFTTSTIGAASNGNILIGRQLPAILGGNNSVRNLVAINTNTGKIFSPNITTNSSVNTIIKKDGVLYLGGAFTEINGISRNKLAAADATTGVIMPWNPGANAVVLSLATEGNIIYAGGSFTVAGGVTRNRLASFDDISGTASSWDPNANGNVFTLIVRNGLLFAGGAFTSFTSGARNRLASFNTTTGALNAWNPGSGSIVNAMTLRHDTLFAAAVITGQPARPFYPIDINTGAVLNFNLTGTIGQTFAMANNDSLIYAGGFIGTFGGISRSNLAAIDLTTGKLNNFNHQLNAQVNALKIYNNKLYVGGSFTTIDGIARSRMAAFDLPSGNLSAWVPNPGFNGNVSTLDISGNAIYLGGAINGTTLAQNPLLPRNAVAGFDLTTGNVLPFAPVFSTGFSVFSLLVDNNVLYTGGSFNSVNGISRNRLAAIDLTTGNLTNWDPNLNNQVFSLEKSGNTILAGGDFTTVGSQNRSRLAQIEMSTGQPTSFNPDVNNQVRGLRVLGNNLYVMGNYTGIGNQARRGLSSFYLSSGKLSSWNPNAADTVSNAISSWGLHMNVFRDTAIIGGIYFQTTGNDSRIGLGLTYIDKTIKTTLSDLYYQRSEVMTVNFDAAGINLPGNIYTLELSDENGNFTNAQVLGTLTTDAVSGTITAALPSGLTPGNKYRVRVNSSLPARTGDDNGQDITVTTVHYLYVNDNGVINDVFTSAVGNNANNGTAAAPFATISYAVSQANAGDTIYVDAGVYFEQVTIDKGITIIGAGAFSSIVVKPTVITPPPGPFQEPGTIQTTQNIGDVNIANLSVTGDDTGVTPIVIQSGGSVRNCRLINGNQGIFFRVNPAVKTAIIENNFIVVAFIGINCQGSGLTAFVSNNYIELTNPAFAAGVFAGLDFGPLPQFTAINNDIKNYNFRAFYQASKNTNITQNRMLISATANTGTPAIEHMDPSQAIATCNWWGTTNFSTIAASVNGNVIVAPFLSNGTDNSPATGFQPVPGACNEAITNFYVNDNSQDHDIYTTAVGNDANPGTSSAPFATLSHAIAVAPVNSIIHVDAGNYAEQVIFNKAMTVFGAGKDLTTFIKPNGTLIPAPGPFTEIGLFETTQGIGDVHLRNLCINSVDGSSQNIIIQGGGSVRYCKLLNGGQGIFFRIASGSRTASIISNIIQPIGIGINCQGAGLSAFISNNVISKQGGYYSGVFAGLDFGPLPQLVFTNNTVSDYFGTGLYTNAFSSSITQNSITGNQGYAIYQDNGNRLNATCNWYGGSSLNAVVSKFNGNINYTPWLSSGVDNSSDPGFQPQPNVCIGNPYIVNINTVIPESCNGAANGQIYITVTGGVAPFQFTWTKDGDPGFVSHAEDPLSLGQGTYRLSMSDAIGTTMILGANGLPTSIVATVTGPAALNASATGTNVNCNGGNNGTATVSVSGGTAPYTYLWSNGDNTASIQSLVAGTYSVTVTDNHGCIFNAQYEVTQPDQLTVSGTASNVSCSGGSNGSVAVTVTGGTQPYSYVWSNGASTQSITGLAAGTYSVTVTDAHNCTTLTQFSVTEPAPLTASASGNHVSCNGGSNGSAQVNVSGGTSPYTYLWNTGSVAQEITGLVAGNYSVTVTDAHGCTTSASFEVTEPALLAASATGSAVSCFGGSNGSVQANVSGGTAPYSYLWSNGATTQSVSGLVAGTYSVTITDANGCTNTDAYTVTQPTVLSVTVTGTRANCNGSATATPAGGTAPYSYLWNNGATAQTINSVPAGTYTVTVTDANGCTVTGSFTILGGSPINPTTTFVQPTCFGLSNGSITVTGATGTLPFTYNINGSAFQASNVFTGLSAGTYVVGVKDATGCADFTTRIVTQPGLLVATLDSVRKSCAGASTGKIFMTITGGTGTKTYSWTGPNGFTSTVQDPNNIPAGTYSVTVTDARGCTTGLTAVVEEWPAVVISETVVNVNCRNDFSGSIDITVTGGTGNGFTYSWTGPAGFSATTEDISAIRSGTYRVTVTDQGSACPTLKSIVVSQPGTLLSVSATTTAVNGCISLGSITATGAGGTAPYQYNLDGGVYQSDSLFVNIRGGIYTLGVKDANGCTASRSVTVADNGRDAFENNNLKTQAKLITIGTPINARIAIVTDTTDWFRFAVPAGGGSYVLSLTHPSASFVFDLFPTGNNYTVITPVDSSGTTKSYNLSGGVTYNIRVTGGLSYDCYELSVNVAALPFAGKELYTVTPEIINDKMTARVYPNPHQGSFTIAVDAPDDGEAAVELFNSNGQKVITRKVMLIKGAQNTIRFSDVREAVLFYRIISGKQTIGGKVIGQF